VWFVGSGAVCFIQKRTYQVGEALAMSVESETKTWLQYVPRPLIARAAAPACCCADVIEAVPEPPQSGVTTDQRPPGVVEAWFSKPSQNTAPDGHDPPCGVDEEGELGVVLDGELGELELGELGELGEVGVVGKVSVGEPGVLGPLHASPLNVKFSGGA